MEPGLYLTFFREGEPRDRELPPVGPLEHVVFRESGLVADRRSVHHLGEADRVNTSRWIEAELELQRAMGNEPGGARRPHLRVAAAEGVYLRFASFGEAAEVNPAPELGPFAVVTIGPRGVEADGALLAVPTGSKRALWDLTSTTGKDLAGLVRPDIAFRSERTSYHAGARAAPTHSKKSAAPEMALRSAVVAPPFRARTRESAPALAPAVARPAVERPAVATRSIESPGGGASRGVATTPAPARAAVQYSDAALSSLLTRVSANPRPAPTTGVGGRSSRRALEWADALWGMRFVIIGVLVLMVAAFLLVSLRGTVSAPSVNTVGIGKTITGARWDYTVNNVSRTTTAGEATSRGIYLVVLVAVRNHTSEGALLSTSAFSLIDSTGAEYRPLSESAAPYQSSQNNSSPYIWAHDYPLGRFVTAPLIFEVPQSIRGLQFVIREVPATRVKLD